MSELESGIYFAVNTKLKRNIPHLHYLAFALLSLSIHSSVVFKHHLIFRFRFYLHSEKVSVPLFVTSSASVVFDRKSHTEIHLREVLGNLIRNFAVVLNV
jgi:hypothetical protein